jgi:isoleucyl-tRNA synthetase
MGERVIRAYDRFEFHPVYHNLHNFCVLDLSSFYLDIIKDRLYVSPAKSTARRSAQTALHEILEVLVRLMAPILSFTSDEIWEHMSDQGRLPSVHMDLFMPIKREYKDSELASRWETIMTVRREVTKALEIARKEKRIGHSLDAAIKVALPAPLLEALRPYGDQLRFLFIVSSVQLVSSEEIKGEYESEELPGVQVEVSLNQDTKCERCWVHDPSVGDNAEHPTICGRCLDAMAEMGFVGT